MSRGARLGQRSSVAKHERGCLHGCCRDLVGRLRGGVSPGWRFIGAAAVRTQRVALHARVQWRTWPRRVSSPRAQQGTFDVRAGGVPAGPGPVGRPPRPGHSVELATRDDAGKRRRDQRYVLQLRGGLRRSGIEVHDDPSTFGRSFVSYGCREFQSRLDRNRPETLSGFEGVPDRTHWSGAIHVNARDGIRLLFG